MAADAAAPDPSASQLDFVKNKVRLLRGSTASDFDAWISLIRAVEESSTNDIEVIDLVYRSFLLEFPLCYGYWIKYATHRARLCSCKEVEEVYEQAVQAIPFSVDLWVNYCSFGVLAYEDPADVRRLFERGLSLVGKDYLCYRVWDKYIDFEHSQKQWIKLATIYINTLKFPTRKLHQYYNSFRKLLMLEQEATCCNVETASQKVLTCEVANVEESEEDISTEVACLFSHRDGYLRSDAVKRYLFAGDRFYQRSNKIDGEISCFEAHIKRPFFHVKPLDDHQLENWHQYLDFVEKHGDFDWAVKLYERCLIPCAYYSEFWIRYVEFVDAKGGRELANYALSRASSCFIKEVPSFRMYHAMFKEQIGDASGARSLFVEGSRDCACDFFGNINRLAHMEKRMGNMKGASEIYETAIEDAVQKDNFEIIPELYTNFAQFKYVASGSIGDAKEVFVKGIKQAPCKPMIKGLIQFMTTHGGPAEIPMLDSVIANAITSGFDVSTALSFQDREDISLVFLEFVDLYGGIQDIRKAWARHSKLFPHKMRNLLQYSAPENTLQESNKRRRTESLMAGHHDASLEDIRELKPLTKSDTSSLLNDKKVKMQMEDKNTMDSGKEDTVIAEEQKILGSEEVHQAVPDTGQECIDMAHVQDTFWDKSGIRNQMNIANQEIDQDLSLCEQIDQSPKSLQSVDEKSPVAESNHDSPSKSIAGSKETNAQDKAKTVDISASGDPGIIGSSSKSLSLVNLPKEGSPYNPAQTSTEFEEMQHLKAQVKLETDSERDVSINIANLEKPSDSPDPAQYHREVSADPCHDYIQASQPQQLPVHVQPSSSQMTTMPTNPWGSQFFANIAVSSQAQFQHQMSGSQMYQCSNLALAGQTVHQQQELAYAMPQSNETPSQTQAQFFVQPVQGNQQYFQTMQGYASQMWQYYQQQLYCLQVQHNQQMQSLQQQQLPIEHLQQKYMQQVQQLNQQMVLWQQQVQQQQQQSLQVQQQPDKQQDQHRPSSVDTKHEQNKQQQSQMEHQSQHLQQWQQQQQQQLLYLQQQQQQQQMYLQQQQQEQQLVQQQQQHLSELPQQQQDLIQQQQLFQQQQQQLFQHQQQQMLLLQQQQQQFLQQQTQQYLQQQTNQQDLKAQNCDFNPQHARSQQMPHDSQAEASQSDGSKLRSTEQYESSHPPTPQSKRSNQ